MTSAIQIGSGLYVMSNAPGAASKCVRCGTGFVKSRFNHVYCSRECKELYKVIRKNGPLNDKKCLFCEKSFSPFNRKQIYCCHSCGCQYRDRNVEQYRGRHNHYRGRTPEDFIKGLMNKKRRRSEMTVADAIMAYHRQNGLCAITGIEMTRVTGSGRISTNISIDRIDSSKGYSKENIQLVCHAVNIMKSALPMDEFLDWCELALAANRGWRRGED
jgi:hypothetical protein